MKDNKINEIVKQVTAKWHGYWDDSYSGTNPGFYLITGILLSSVAAVMISYLFGNSVLLFTITFLLSFGLGWLLLYLIGWLCKTLFRVEVKPIICTLIMVLILYFLAYVSSGGTAPIGTILFTVILLPAFIFWGKGIWAFLRRKPTVLVWGLTGISTFIVILASAFIMSKGFKDTYPEEYLSLNKHIQNTYLQDANVQDVYMQNTYEKGEYAQETSGFGEMLALGQYPVATLDYGMNQTEVNQTAVMSESVDLSDYVNWPDGITGWYHKEIKKNDTTETPIAGRVWYPEGKKNCPVLFFAHGNHSIAVESYLGYEYLGEYLASHGYVFVSVDQNYLNFLSNENDARAVLLLENIKKLKEYNEDRNSPLFELIDYQRIAIGGHSRGGEMAATAYLFNDYDYYPENGAITFDYHFDINSIIAVSPSANQYRPAGHAVELEDVNYLLIHGANDQDVSYFMGNVQYENVSFTGAEDYIKSSLYIAGANHGQFNSRWGLYDMPGIMHLLHNVNNFISQEEQEQILKAYAKVFLDKTLSGAREYEDLLTDYVKYSPYFAETPYIQQYQLSGFQCIADFEEDSSLGTAGMEGMYIQGDGMENWSEEMLYFSGRGTNEPKENHALRLQWKEEGADISFYGDSNDESVLDLAGKEIQFDICNMDEEDVRKGSYRLLDYTVLLEDENGNRAVMESGNAPAIYPAFPVKLSKLQYITGEVEYKHHFQTVSFQAEQFRRLEDGFDQGSVRKITIHFEGKEGGDIMLDNMGISDGKQGMESEKDRVLDAESGKEHVTRQGNTLPQEDTLLRSMIPLKQHGALAVTGNQLTDKEGNAVQLKGVSTHGLSWFPQYVNQETIQYMRDEWGIQVFRLAMYTAEYNGYCTGDDYNKQELRNVISEGVNAAANLGLYVIIDWHILSDSNPLQYMEESIVFFEEMAMRYRVYDNVIYEICNEPNGSTSWKDIKDYADRVIPAIRKYDEDAVILVGTPNWSQYVEQAAADPLSEYENIMYTLHFYADTHRDDLRSKLEEAHLSGLPIFVSEFGICDASGSGSVNIEEANKWIDLLNEYGISYVAWNLSNKDETSALLKTSCDKLHGFEEGDYSDSGRWLIEILQK